MSTPKRKDDHIDICLNAPVDQKDNFFDRFSFEHNALPEIDFSEIDTSTDFLKKKISAPLIISSMTGGTPKAQEINRRLARVAQQYQIPLGIGSARALLEDEKSLSTFQVRTVAPTIPLLANLGAVQLNYGIGVSECQKLVDLLEADALCLHLNPLQEVIQPEGDTNFAGLLKKMENVVKGLTVPVIIKEVGAGISASVAQKLKNIGVTHIDVSGRGGTSWAFIEGQRRNSSMNDDDKKSGVRSLESGETNPQKKTPNSQLPTPHSSNLGNLFANWGIPTPVALQECANISGLKLIAGGGIRSGLDIAKAIALGASYASIALPFLKSAVVSEEEVSTCMQNIIHELKIAMFVTGSKNLSELSTQNIFYEGI